MRNFMELLEARWAESHFVCVGLDSELNKIPQHVKDAAPGGGRGVRAAMSLFNASIVDATHDLVGAYKPNLAFYLAEGSEGILALKDTIERIHLIAPEVPVILDAKWADIGNTNNGYVKFAYDELGADAVTVHPYLGGEALKPFLECSWRGVFVLARTSNPGAGEFQDLYAASVLNATTHDKLFERVAKDVDQRWNANRNCGIVAGATYPAELKELRAAVPTLPILIPGVGAQGGDLEAAVKAADDLFLINSSRGIIFASTEKDFAEAGRAATQTLHDDIIKFRLAS